MHDFNTAIVCLSWRTERNFKSSIWIYRGCLTSSHDWLIDWLYNTGVNGDVVTVAHNTTINLTCTTSGRHTPDWFANGMVVVLSGDKYKVQTSNGRGITATLTINGNLTCETVNVYCEVYNTTEQRFVHMHNTTLRFQGWSSVIWHGLLYQCIVNKLPLKPWYSQVASPHLRMCISNTLTPPFTHLKMSPETLQPLNGNLLTQQ